MIKKHQLKKKKNEVIKGFMENTYNFTVNANDGNIFDYTVDPSGILANYSSISTDVNRKPIEGIIKLITQEIIDQMISEESLVNKLDNRKDSWNYKMMLGKYFDNEGIFYYNIKNKLYPFIYSSKYLKKYYSEL
jgi:hypothetical protein